MIISACVMVYFSLQLYARLDNNDLQLSNIAWNQHQLLPKNYQDSTREIVLIESRKHHLMVPILENLKACLPDWDIHVIGTLENKEFLQDLIEKHHFRLSILETDTFDRDDYGDLLTSPKLWGDMLQADKILMTQTDAWLCENPLMDIEDFMKYDYVGAPWKKNQHSETGDIVGNCGLCLVTRQVMYDLVSTKSFKDFQDEHGGTGAIDKFFCENIPNKPNATVAKAFSVEKVYFHRPIGVHKPFYMNPGKLEKLSEYCPGVEILSTY
jgi:hypothetical protein